MVLIWNVFHIDTHETVGARNNFKSTWITTRFHALKGKSHCITALFIYIRGLLPVFIVVNRVTVTELALVLLNFCAEHSIARSFSAYFQYIIEVPKCKGLQ